MFLRKIPHLVVMAPRDGAELESMLRFMADYADGPIAVRYPRGAVAENIYPVLAKLDRAPVRMGKAEVLQEGSDICFIALGSMVGPALMAAALLQKEGLMCTTINARFVKPLDVQTITRRARECRVVVTLEDGVLAGGFGSAVLESFASENVRVPRVERIGIPDRFIEGGPVKILHENLGFTPEGIAQRARRAYWDAEADKGASLSVFLDK